MVDGGQHTVEGKIRDKGQGDWGWGVGNYCIFKQYTYMAVYRFCLGFRSCLSTFHMETKVLIS